MPATTFVGLDIGSTSIRAVEASASKDRSNLHRFGQIELAPDAVVGGVVKDRRAVAGALRELWSNRDFNSRNVAIGVTHQQVVVREIDLPDIPAKDRKQALPHLVRDVLPLPVDQAIIDFYPLGRAGETPGTIRGLVIAAPKDAVLETVQTVESAGLHVTQVDLSCFAALRAAAHLADDTEAMLDIGATVTNIIVHQDGTPKIVRAIPRGGAEITKTLATRMEIDGTQAEQLKRSVGLTGEEPAGVAAIVADAIRPFVTEIRTSLGYFTQIDRGNAVRRLALVGGGSQLAGLPDLLTESLGVPAYLSDPLQRVNDNRKGRHDDLRQSRSSACVAIGLTLGAA